MLHQAAPLPRNRGPRPANRISTTLRFAFYGRISTARFQDPISSREWQLEFAAGVIGGSEHITVEFFDTACSRTLPWQDRPQASALLEAAAQPDRAFDAVVIGEFERGFGHGQAQAIIAQLNAFGVAVWMPEFDGTVDLGDPTHRALLMMPVTKPGARFCVPGGAPPPPCTLKPGCRADTSAAAHRMVTGSSMPVLIPTPPTRSGDGGCNCSTPIWTPRPHVQWIFAERLAGESCAGIARTLNARGVASPSAHDPERNPHHSGTAWTLRTVAAILANPRYTGRQVWNRQRIDHHETRPGDTSSRPSRRKPTHRWTSRDQWSVSPEIVHPPLVSNADWLAAQEISALATPKDGNRRRYRFTGLVICGLCGRRAEGHRAHDRARYRCRHGHTSSSDAQPGRFKTLYVRDDQIIAEAGSQLSGLAGVRANHFDTHNLVHLLRMRGFTMVCTPVSITLDTSNAEPAEQTASTVSSGPGIVSSQLVRQPPFVIMAGVRG